VRDTAVPAAATVQAARWSPPREHPRLPAGEVHLWRAGLDPPPRRLEQLARVLSPDELRRADAFSRASQRRRFIAGRGLLRVLLGRYLERAPGRLGLRYGPQGKPELESFPEVSAVRFNCSHSRELVLYAFAQDRRVGVDLEAVRPLPEAEGIARLCFSWRERMALAALAPEDREAAVLRGWTRKEAYAKAVGEGLARPLDGIEVSLGISDRPALHAVDGDPGIAARWSLLAFLPEEGYVAALVVEGRPSRVMGYGLDGWAPAAAPGPPQASSYHGAARADPAVDGHPAP
jgi:4'-phosphopantetheinyl transferase